MPRPIDAGAMLATAQRLAGAGAGRGRPAVCDLRRATSTAYYAVFHQITRHAAITVVPGATERDIALAARWITHSNVKAACTTVIKAAAPSQAPKAESARIGLIQGGGQAGIHPDLLALARRYIDLQRNRELADYDNAYDPYRPVTIGHIATAESALGNAWRLWLPNASHQARSNAHEQYQRFLLLTYLGPRDTQPR